MAFQDKSRLKQFILDNRPGSKRINTAQYLQCFNDNFQINENNFYYAITHTKYPNCRFCLRNDRNDKLDYYSNSLSEDGLILKYTLSWTNVLDLGSANRDQEQKDIFSNLIYDALNTHFGCIEVELPEKGAKIPYGFTDLFYDSSFAYISEIKSQREEIEKRYSKINKFVACLSE
jgi:hypothetical protein